jgi:hypothetical protein
MCGFVAPASRRRDCEESGACKLARSDFACSSSGHCPSGSWLLAGFRLLPAELGAINSTCGGARTAIFRARATLARRMPRRFATSMRPALQGREARWPGQHRVGRFVEGGAHRGIANAGDRCQPRPFRLTGTFSGSGRNGPRPLWNRVNLAGSSTAETKVMATTGSDAGHGHEPSANMPSSLTRASICLCRRAYSSRSASRARSIGSATRSRMSMPTYQFAHTPSEAGCSCLAHLQPEPAQHASNTELHIVQFALQEPSSA